MTWASAITAWLGLVALQALATGDSSTRVGQAFDDLNSIVERVLNVNVAAIPDLRDNATENL